MSTRRHITRGIQKVQASWQLVFIAFLFKLCFSLLFILPLQHVITGALARRPAAGLLLTEWDLTPIIDLLFSNIKTLENYGSVLFIGIVIAFIFHLFLNGGIFRTLAVSVRWESPPLTLERFTGRCGRYFPLFLKIALLSGIFYCAAAVIFIILSNIGTDLLLGTSSTEPMRFVARLIQAVMLVLLLLFIHMGVTYMKIIAAVRERRPLFTILKETVLFLRSGTGKALILYITLLTGLALMTGLFWLTSRLTGRLPAAVSILGLFLLQQGTSFIRSWYRLVGCASQIEFYTENRK